MSRSLLSVLALSALLSACQVEDAEDIIDSSPSQDTSDTKSIPQELVGTWAYAEMFDTEFSVSKISADGTFDVYREETADKNRDCYWKKSGTITALDNDQYLIALANRDSYKTTITYADGTLHYEQSPEEFSGTISYTAPEIELKSIPVCKAQSNTKSITGIWDRTPDTEEPDVEHYLITRSDGTLAKYVYDTGDFGTGQNCYWKTIGSLTSQGMDRYNFRLIGAGDEHYLATQENNTFRLLEMKQFAKTGSHSYTPSSRIQDESHFSPICVETTSLSDIVGIWKEAGKKDEIGDYLVITPEGSMIIYEQDTSTDSMCYEATSTEGFWQITDLGNAQIKVKPNGLPQVYFGEIRRTRRTLHFQLDMPFGFKGTIQTDLQSPEQITPICQD